MNTPNKTLKIANLGNVAEALPFVLGHYPDDSLVLHLPGDEFIDGPILTCPFPDDPTDWIEAAQTAAYQFTHLVHEHGRTPDNGIIVYLCREPRSDETAEDTAELLRPIANALVDTLTEHRGDVLQTLGLVAGRWWAYTCDIPGCCEGEPLPTPDDPSSVAAQLIKLGYSPGRRTRDIAKEFQPNTSHLFLNVLSDTAYAFKKQCLTQRGHAAALTTTHDHIETAMRRFREGATELDRALTARLIVGLQDNSAVDEGAAYAEDDDLPHARRLWAYLARHCAAPFTSEALPALTLYAFVAWRQGDLIAARLALRDALSTDPDYELAVGIHLGIHDGHNPRDLLAYARENRDTRIAHAQQADQAASEYRPVTDSTADRHREALDAATDLYAAQASTYDGQLLARYGTINIIGGALADFRNGRPQLMDQIAARITLGLQDRESRDAALSTGDENDLPAERQLWGYLARRCVPPHTDKAPPLLTLLGWVAWRQGDTVTASHAFTDALDIDPNYALAEHLRDGIRNECDPAALLAVYRAALQRFAADRDDFDDV
ncbi:DUF4192 family protein [Streptomyces noursei]|uniref:DUF4192 family protein n=1 Tax=Streptomyces noursei TaxID=1971 RepID=UPI0036D26193